MKTVYFVKVLLGAWCRTFSAYIHNRIRNYWDRVGTSYKTKVRILFWETLFFSADMNFYFFHLFRPDIITPNGLNVKRDLHEFQNLHAKSKVMRSFKFTVRFGDILIIFAETKQRFTSTVVNRACPSLNGM